MYLAGFSIAIILVIAVLPFLKKRRRKSRSGEPLNAVRMANLNTSADANEGWWQGPLLALFVLATTGFILAVQWQAIPKRFPIHWGIQGQPNRWAERSFGSVFGLLVVGLALVVLLTLIGQLISRSSPGHEGRPAIIRTTKIILALSSWLVTVLMCSISLLPLVPDPTKMVPILVLGALIFSLGIVGYAVFRATKLAPAMSVGAHSTDSRFWKAGTFYFNPEDSALMVPKRTGFGYTFNFGRPISWWILGAILLLPLILAFFMSFHKTHAH